SLLSCSWSASPRAESSLPVAVDGQDGNTMPLTCVTPMRRFPGKEPLLAHLCDASDQGAHDLASRHGVMATRWLHTEGMGPLHTSPWSRSLFPAPVASRSGSRRCY